MIKRLNKTIERVVNNVDEISYKFTRIAKPEDEPILFQVKLSLNTINELNKGKFINDDGGIIIAQTKLANMLMDVGFNYVHVVSAVKVNEI